MCYSGYSTCISCLHYRKKTDGGLVVVAYLPVGYHGEPKVHLFHNIRILQGLYYPKRLKVTYSTTRPSITALEGLGIRIWGLATVCVFGFGSRLQSLGFEYVVRFQGLLLSVELWSLCRPASINRAHPKALRPPNQTKAQMHMNGARRSAAAFEKPTILDSMAFGAAVPRDSNIP